MLLPTDLLEYFEVISVKELCEISTKKMVFHIQLEEKNQLPKSYNQSDYQSKGFYPEKTIQDFPVRGKAPYLIKCLLCDNVHTIDIIYWQM